MKFFYTKNSSDPFRIFVEFSAFIILAQLFHLNTQIGSILASSIGLLGTVLIIYAGVFLFTFRKPPMILSDLNFTKIGLDLLKYKKYFVFVFLILFCIGVFLGLVRMTTRLLAYEPSTISLCIALLFILALGFYNSMSFGYFAFYNRTFYSPFLHLFRNVKESSKYNFLLSKDAQYFKDFNLYQDFDLKSKPNIVIVNLESYGAINLRDEFFRKEMLEKLEAKNSILEEKGFHSASIFSTPPAFAGGSWLSYTTLLFGTKVSDQNQYEILLKGNNNFNAYQSIPRYLDAQGYKNFHLCPLGGGFAENVDWNLVSKTIGAHQYFTFDDMEYAGKTLKFMDLGVSVPDQYAIHKAKTTIDKTVDQPHFMFYSTLNSHTPFHSPMQIEDDWKNIETLDFATNDHLSSKKEKYKAAVHYQLDFIIDYIAKDQDDNTIYLLFGDHQPPFIKKVEYGWETIVHVISKDKAFVNLFSANGFSDNLKPDEEGSPIWHESIMSIFMKALLQRHGDGDFEDLPHLKNGIQFEVGLPNNSSDIKSKV